MPEQSEEQYFAMLRSGKPFFYLRRRASPGLVEAVNALGEPGLAIQREPDRLYPQTSLAAHVIGYTDIDGHGVAGMERAFDKYLSDPATRGQPLTLSISSRVQQALEHELGDAMSDFSAIGAAGVVMDVHTGEVLAMTSLPDDQSQRRRARARRTRCSIARRWAFTSSARPSSRSPSRWRWTAASSRASARTTIAPTCFPPTAIWSTTPIRSAAHARSPRS